MATGMLSLVGGLWSGLLRLGWAGPLLHQRVPVAHGPLMVCGFLGTVISLERAVALDRTWAFLAPGLTGIGGVLTLAGVGGMVGPLFITIGSLGLIAIFGTVLSIQAAPFAMVMAGGSGAWAVGNGLWLAGEPVHALVPWWIGFLVLTIAGERLELSRMLFHAPWTKGLFLGLIGGLGGGLLLSVSAPDLGFRAMGGALVAVALWLGIFDVARHTVHTQNLTRYTAVCLLTGYAWLAVGGVLAMVYGNPGAGRLYDAILHAIFVGFVFSMIFGHAPIIFPSVLGVSIPYRPRLYVPVGLLHGTLLLRTVGDLAYHESARLWGGWGNAVAIALFLGMILYSAVNGQTEHSEIVDEGAAEPKGKAIPDLDLSVENDRS
jgi:hypothetical protein